MRYTLPMRYLENLNERQREAVLHAEGPLLIVAGAGAGKTKAITHRIAHLISQGVPPRTILAVTFTNKAAEEMRQRVWKLLHKADGMPTDLPAESSSSQAGMRDRIIASARPPSGQAGAPLITTFHSLGVRILREFHNEAGIARGFSIWDRDDSVKAIKKILNALGKDELRPTAVLSAISREKGNGTSVPRYEPHTRFEKEVKEIWSRYEKVLRDEEALDFDDLLLRTQYLLAESDKVRKLLQNRWRHITIDEYQDTNRSQYEIARLLAGESRNICVVGDTDQNIYTWRGADMRHLLSFEKSFPGTRIVMLEQNYRSTRTILTAANAIVEKNVMRAPKHLFTENDTGEPIGFYAARTEGDEAWFVAEQARILAARGTPLSEIAVLYRENFQSRILEQAFLAAGLPYRVLGTRFFERKEVKDLLSYLRAALNPRSKSDLARIAGTPPRGIGAVTLAKWLETGADALPAAARAKIDLFRTTLEKIAHAARTLSSSEATHFAFEVSGMAHMFQMNAHSKTESDDGAERIENVRELVNLAAKYDFEAPPSGIERLLEEAALMTDQDSLDPALSGERAGQERVSLMTAHASKGLEFDAVFITGLEQGLFPESRSDFSAGVDPEEERRLFYVALTRARRRVFLSFAAERSKWGKRELTVPSEFLDDIDPRIIEYARVDEHERERIIE